MQTKDHCRYSNFLNVITNLPFSIIGIYGLFMLKSRSSGAPVFIVAVLFMGMWHTGIGSACYHYTPNNATLVYDRIPMTIIFTSFVCLVIGWHIDKKVATVLLVPLLVLGVGSVLWWQYTEGIGKGDLRLYGFVQFYPPLLIPLIIWLFPVTNNKTRFALFGQMIVWYGIAKMCELYDEELYNFKNFISGHALKHLLSALALWQMIRWVILENTSVIR